MNEIFLDTETTGLSPKGGDRVLEIACIETENLIPTKKIFHKIINPEKEVTEEAFKIHGFSNDFLKNKKKFKDIVDEFLNFINGKKLIIHNAEFDLSHLNNELKIIGKETLKNDVVDTLTLARDKFPGSPSSLDALCKRYRIDNSKRTQHTALIDCDLLSKVYINLIDQKEPTLNFYNETNDNKQINDKNILYFKKVIKPSDEEKSKHNKYLKTSLKKNFF